MAHFAEINENNIVQRVIVIRNEDMIDSDGNESENIGKSFIESIGLNGKWIQTSYNGSFRGKYAGMGDIYDPEKDEFISPNINIQ